MRIKDLADEIGVSTKELIAFLSDNGYEYKSHMQKVADDAYDFAKANFIKDENKEEVKSEATVTTKAKVEPPIAKKFAPDDLIACKSVVPYKLNALSVDKQKIYHWEYYGDVDYLTYRDLSALRRSNYITKPWILIDNADLCYQWRRELGDTYKYFLNVEYPEEFFEVSDDQFKENLEKAPDVLKEVVKSTAISMIHAENYPTVQKVRIIDDLLGTCLIDFLS